jgi:hypothetical protein
MGEDYHINQFKALVKDLERGSAPSFMKTTDNIVYERDMYYNFQLWTRIVETYPFTSLTNQPDRLIALSGIAKLMHVLIQDTYIADMRLGNIEKDIEWYKHNDSPSEVPPTPVRASTALPLPLGL